MIADITSQPAESETVSTVASVGGSSDYGTADSSAAEALQSSLASHGALPYLFIGSGISRRYLGLPDWNGLLQKFAAEAGEDFNYHLATARGEYPLAATRIAQAFHERWWNDASYAHQRAEYARSVRDDEGGLKVAIAEYIRSHDTLAKGLPGIDDPKLHAELELLRLAVVDGVITTNYDSLTDQLFPTYRAYIGQDELLMSDAQFIAEVYKIHGDATQPLTLVVTDGDYKEFSRRNHYLAAKLLTIFAEHPVLFVGYSLSDAYLNEILDNIATAVGSRRLGELGRRIYFIEWNADPDFHTLVEQTSIERGGFRFPITRIETHDFRWLWEALSQLERPFPASVLRELRKHVFDLVTHPDPSQNREVVRAIPIDADEAGEYRVVFGVGVFSERDLQNLSTIGRSLQREDLERDVLGVRGRGLDAENLLRFGISEGIRPGPSDHLPVHKYLCELGRLGTDGSVDFADLPAIVKTLALKVLTVGEQAETRFERDVAGVYKTPREVMESDLPLYFKLQCLVLLDPHDFSLGELREVLARFYESSENGASTVSTHLRRAICHYDRLAARAKVAVA